MIYHSKMGELETLIELNRIEKEKRGNRLEEKLRIQEYYVELEVLFDPLTQTLNACCENNLFIANQLLDLLKVMMLKNQRNSIIHLLQNL